MRILKLKLNNFGSFDELELDFQKTNLIIGYNHDIRAGNGSGKTTVVSAILFGLFGDKILDKKLSSLIQKGKEHCNVNLLIKCNNNIIEISRSYPSKLELTIDDVPQELSGITEKQKKISEFVGDAESFQRFRIMDNSKGVNILDFTNKQLKKILMGFAEEKFDNIRAKLLKMKSEREKFNKDQVIYKHAPSDNRLQILQNGLKNINKVIAVDEADMEDVNDEYGKYTRQEGSLTSEINILNSQKKKLEELKSCPTCLQDVPDEHKNKIISDILKKVRDIVPNLEKCIQNKKGIIKKKDEFGNKMNKLKSQISKIESKIMRLETRLKQKDYKYTEKDILLVKKAIEVIDKFASYYVIEWVRIVEPIVNSHISKLDMEMKFIVDEKQNISIQINREGKEFTYDELSTGEKLFISFVFNIALLIEQQQTGLLIADEGLDSLSPENIERILSIIENIPMQLICISQHRDLNISSINTIYVEKTGGVSQLSKEEERIYA